MVISVTMERAVLASRRRNDEKAILFSTSLVDAGRGRGAVSDQGSDGRGILVSDSGLGSWSAGFVVEGSRS
jgi:hypothetical protein